MKILVTGASRGLGFAIASRLSEENDVVGCARVESIEAPPFHYIGGVDLADTTTFQKVNFADFDVIINNAAIALDGLLATQGEFSIRNTIEVNLIGTLLLTKSWVRARLAIRKSGNLINITSIIGVRGYSGLVAYSASKAGLDGATRALARELGPKGFRINSVLPGYIETEMSKSLSASQKDQIIRRTPLGRLATVNDITPLIKFLISPSASFITGQCITVDGGICV